MLDRLAGLLSVEVEGAGDDQTRWKVNNVLKTSSLASIPPTTISIVPVYTALTLYHLVSNTQSMQGSSRP